MAKRAAFYNTRKQRRGSANIPYTPVKEASDGVKALQTKAYQPPERDAYSQDWFRRVCESLSGAAVVGINRAGESMVWSLPASRVVPRGEVGLPEVLFLSFGGEMTPKKELAVEKMHSDGKKITLHTGFRAEYATVVVVDASVVLLWRDRDGDCIGARLVIERLVPWRTF